MRFFVFLLLFLFLRVSGQTNALSRFLEERAFSGVVLMADSGRVWFKAHPGYRDFPAKVPMQEDAVFELASVSKQFTAMVIMLLEEKGKLGFDDPVSRYLSIPYSGITIRHLLTHTSGLPDYQAIMDKNWDKSRVAGNPEILEYLNRYAPPALFRPGERYDYSNTGYVLLASIAEKVSGKDFISLCHKWLFRPIGMQDADIRTAAVKGRMGRFAKGHIYVKERQAHIHADSFPASNYTIWLGNRKGPGRISASAADLLKWDQALYSGKLVGEGTLKKAFSPMVLLDGSSSPYGFGWDLSGGTALGRVVSHDGDNPGYKTKIIRSLDRRLTIIVLCNNASEHFSDIILELQRAAKDYLDSKATADK